MELYKFQQTAVNVVERQLTEYKGAILRADEGLGKTLMAAEAAKGKNTLWVGPAASLKDVQKKVEAYDNEHSITFVSYHKFADINKLSAKEMRSYSFIVFDEAHYLRNYSAGWTQRFVRLSAHGRRFLFLSATPAIKSPKDYVYVLRKTGVYKDMSTTEWYQRYFDAKPSKFGDFLEFGEFRNAEDFKAHLLKVSYDVTQEQADKDIPPTNFEFIKLKGVYTPPKDITGETRTRVDAGLLKQAMAAPHIRDKGRPALVLTNYHGCAELLAKHLGVSAALTPRAVQKSIERFKARQQDYIVTTIGLTNSSYDLNECNQVFFVETSYSFMTDRQSMRRCLRLGKRQPLDVTYFYLQGERPFITSMKRQYLKSVETSDHSGIGPSSLARLEKCPGSFYFKDNNEAENGAAVIGTLHHETAERLINNSRLAISPILKNSIDGYTREARLLKKRLGMHGVEDSLKAPQIHADFRGTVDFWAYDYIKGDLFVLDYKNGKWPVDAHGNRQLQAYALLVCEAKNIKPQNIHTVIWQRDKRKSASYTACEFKKAANDIKHIIELVEQAKEDPKKWLGADCNDRFCPAKDFHNQGGL